MSQQKNRGLLKILIIFFVVSVIFWLMPASLAAEDTTEIELLQAELDAANLALEEAQASYDAALADLENLQNDPESTEEALADAQAVFDAAVITLADAEAAVLAAQEALDAAMNSNGSEQNDENGDVTGQEEEVIPEDPVGSSTEEFQMNPVLSTDKEDYSPGETVTISGTGFAPDTSYVIEVLRPDGSIVKGDGSFEFGSDSVISDEGGSFVYNYILNGIAGLYNVSAIDVDGVVLATTSFTDCPKGMIVIHKTGLLGDDEATFTVSGPGYSNSKTRGNQTITFSNLPKGTYTVTETWPDTNVYCYKQDIVDPAGPYCIDGNRIDIDIVNKVRGYLRVYKDGLEDGDEAIFTVSDGNGFTMEKQFGNGDKVFGPLPKGTYTVTESFPAGNVWLYDSTYDESTKYTISCEDTYEEAFITNVARKGKIEITKSGLLDCDEVIFRVYGPDGYNHGEVMGNETVTIEGLYYGEYTIEEEYPDTNKYCYKIKSITPEGPYKVEDCTVKIDVVNKAKGKIKIIKKGFEDCDTATFTLCGPDDFEESFTMGNGCKVFCPVPKGSYKIKEEGDDGNKWVYDVSFCPEGPYVIDCDSDYCEVKINNTARKGSVEIFKTDATSGLPLGGSIFQLFIEGSWIQIGPDVVLGDDGHYKWDGLEYGHYKLVEAIAPEGYLVEGPVEFDISPEGTLNFVFKEEIADPRIPGTIIIFKYAGGDPLEGVEFDVTNGDGFAVKVVTGADGTATLTDLAWDTYYIKEVSVPDPTLYEINPNQFSVTISRFNLSERVDVENGIIVPTPTPTPEAAGIEVLGISEELPFTGMNMYIPISGAGVVLTGIAMFIASIRRKKK